MATCGVAFGIRAWSRTLVRSLRPHPQRLAYLHSAAFHKGWCFSLYERK